MLKECRRELRYTFVCQQYFFTIEYSRMCTGNAWPSFIKKAVTLHVLLRSCNINHQKAPAPPSLSWFPLWPFNLIFTEDTPLNAKATHSNNAYWIIFLTHHQIMYPTQSYVSWIQVLRYIWAGLKLKGPMEVEDRHVFQAHFKGHRKKVGLKCLWWNLLSNF